MEIAKFCFNSLTSLLQSSQFSNSDLLLLNRLKDQFAQRLSETVSLQKPCDNPTVIIHGLQIERVSVSTISEWIFGHLKLQIQIHSVRVFGKKRTISVSLMSNAEKAKLFSRCHLLKGSTIGISDDLPPHQRTKSKSQNDHSDAKHMEKVAVSSTNSMSTKSTPPEFHPAGEGELTSLADKPQQVIKSQILNETFDPNPGAPSKSPTSEILHQDAIQQNSTSPQEARKSSKTFFASHADSHLPNSAPTKHNTLTTKHQQIPVTDSSHKQPDHLAHNGSHTELNKLHSFKLAAMQGRDAFKKAVAEHYGELNHESLDHLNKSLLQAKLDEMKAKFKERRRRK